MSSASDQETIAFESTTAWDEWLATNHAESNGIWMRISKKSAITRTITYAEALDAAICYGWIDGQGKSYDDQSRLQRFTSRRARSVWSKLNTERVERLTQAGRMKAAGMAQVEAAKRDGRWDRAYASPSAAALPEDFLTELNSNKDAKAFFETLNKRNTYAIYYRLQSAKKPETRQKRLREILAMLERGEKFHP